MRTLARSQIRIKLISAIFYRNVWLENRQHSVCNYAYATIASLKDLSIVVMNRNRKEPSQLTRPKTVAWSTKYGSGKVNFWDAIFSKQGQTTQNNNKK